MKKIFDDINILLTLDDKNKIKLSQVGGKKRTKSMPIMHSMCRNL